MSRKLTPYIYFFILALFANYLPDLVPYYISRLSSGQVHVIGSLSQFSEGCNQSEKEGYVCDIQYRLPAERIRAVESVGLGIILFPIEVVCDDPQKSHLVTFSPDDSLWRFLRTYQTFNLDSSCKKDILVRNWHLKNYQRYGYSQSPVTTGSRKWVARVKDLVEQSITGLLALSFFMFLALFFLLKVLERITQISMRLPPFDEAQYFWLAFILATSGVVSQIYPVDISFDPGRRAVTFLGFLAVSTPIMSFVFSDKNARDLFSRAKLKIFDTAKNRTIFCCILGALLVSNLYLNYLLAYPISILLWSLLGAWASIVRKNPMMLLFCVAGLSDGFKVLMVPNLPASRFTITYMIFNYAYAMIRQISILEENARFQAGTSVAAQITHDIRSPLAALKIVTSKINGEVEDLKLLRMSITRLQDIANQSLHYLRKDIRMQGVPETKNLVNILKTIIEEKRAERSSEKEINLRLNFQSETFTCLIHEPSFCELMSNLLNNSYEAISIKPGHIDVNVHEHKNWLVIEIRDTGKGILPDVLQNLGKRGVSYKERAGEEGLGIGVYHAKKTILSWGGEFNILSTVGIGSNVIIKLPLTRC